MHRMTKLLVGVCAAAFVASTAVAQTTGTSDTTVTRTRRTSGSGIRVTKEGPKTRTGTASGVYGGTTSTDTLSRTSSNTSTRPSTNASSCTGVNCSPNASATSGVNNNLSGSTCAGVNHTRTDSLNNGTACTGTNCTGNSNTNANACMGTSCNAGTASYNSNGTGATCATVNSSDRTLVPSNADTMTAGDVDMAMVGVPDTQLLQGMTDENILAHLAMGDSMEIKLAQHALQQTQNQRVRDVANTLIADHTASLQQGQTAAQQAGITPQLAVGDTVGLRMMDHMSMSNMAGNASGNMNMSHGGMMAYSDANFIRHNVMMHRHTLSERQTLSGMAKNDAVRNKVSATIPAVQKHLFMARQLATDLHVDLNAPMKMNMGTTTPP